MNSIKQRQQGLTFLRITKRWSNLFITLILLTISLSLSAQQDSFASSLLSIEKEESRIKKLPSLLLPQKPSKDDYISHINKLELHLNLIEKLKTKYLSLEKEILSTEIKSIPEETVVNDANEAVVELRKVLLNNVNQDNLMGIQNSNDLSQSMLNEMYLEQVLTTKTKQSNKSIFESNSPQNLESLDSLHALVIEKIIFYEEHEKKLKSEMHSVSELLKKRTHIQYAQPTRTTANNTSQASPYNAVAVNIQNILRLSEVKDKIFSPHFDIDNKLIEDRKGFILPPLNNGKKAIRYESPINGSQHDGLVLKSNSSNVHNISQGIVTKVGTSSENKKFIVIKHDNDFMSVYTNLNQTYVTENEFVRYNQTIGEAHQVNNQDYAIHFQLWKGSKSQNPSHWLKNN